MPQWEVIGGGDKGGILVRESEAIGSPKLSERLATGAVVQEIDLVGERLHYRLLDGAGPPRGWVSVRLGDRELVVPRRKHKGRAAAVGARRAAKTAERVYDEPPIWRRPPPEGAFRLGEFLWAGEAGLEQAPGSEFFPREWYGALMLAPQQRGGRCSLLLMGGSSSFDASCMNDVWRLDLPNLGVSPELDAEGRLAAPCWTLVSPHDGGAPDGEGRRILRKWRPRRDFGCCAARVWGGSGELLYIAGGSGTSCVLGDFWASEDGGKSWVCMHQEPPWGKRKAAALHAVPGRPERLLLVGGMGMYAEVCTDAWTSDDAGGSWTRLEQPPWSDVTGRYRSALLPLPSAQGREDREARMLLLGGCFVDGGEGGGQGLVGLERLMHDAWECRWDFRAAGRESSITWVRWGWGMEERGPTMATVGVECASAAVEPGTGSLVARLPDRDFVSVGAARDPQLLDPAGAQTEATMNVEWHQAELRRHVELVRGERRSHDPAKAGRRLAYVRLAEAGGAAVNRLVFVTSRAVLLSGAGELRRQLFAVALLGARLERSRGLPSGLWRGRVLPLLLPVGRS